MENNMMDKRTAEIFEMYKKNALGLDDTFQFKCRECGKCCKNREDILLTTRDLYNIARELGRMPGEIIERYCEGYIGGTSRMPIIRLLPGGPDKVCPLLRNRKCIVHKAKPAVCALFPLGRAVEYDNDKGNQKILENIKPHYFVQPATCGTKDRTQTVREWLEKFGFPVEDEFYAPWNTTISLVSEGIRKIEEKASMPEVKKILWEATFHLLYINYDIKEELMPQFHENTAELKDIFNEVMNYADAFVGGISDGE